MSPLICLFLCLPLSLPSLSGCPVSLSLMSFSFVLLSLSLASCPRFVGLPHRRGDFVGIEAVGRSFASRSTQHAGIRPPTITFDNSPFRWFTGRCRSCSFTPISRCLFVCQYFRLPLFDRLLGHSTLYGRLLHHLAALSHTRRVAVFTSCNA